MGLIDRQKALSAALVAAAAVAAIALPPARAPASGARPDAAGRVTLPFEARGAQGPIAGVIVVDVAADRLVDVHVTRTDEGVDRRALAADRLGARFRGLPAAPPLAVDAVTGATISSARLIEAVEQRLAGWRAARAAPSSPSSPSSPGEEARDAR